ncbi:hypothetical protein NDU88_002876 [Pleurodeles waltl]|uniref:Uncharacterized protein n=1 Tax=Pleurodeles waltl TaxID=8319 RepID=A0AAV7W0K4_PLEWA|nr:hypothetical protein NDU88_002876 [Pleurodeles waltl]
MALRSRSTNSIDFIVVDQIDTLTSDLQLEEEMTDSSKTDTLNSSSSSTTASSLDKIKVRANTPLIKPPVHPLAILTVLRKHNPPPPPPRLTPVKCEDSHRLLPPPIPVKTNGTLLRNGGLQGGPKKIPNGDVCSIPNSNFDKIPLHSLTHRPEKDRCHQTTTRERVRFSENVQYHGYCPDCDVRYDMKNREICFLIKAWEKVSLKGVAYAPEAILLKLNHDEQAEEGEMLLDVLMLEKENEAEDVQSFL